MSLEELELLTLPKQLSASPFLVDLYCSILSLLCPNVFWQLNYPFLILSVHFRIPASDYLFGIIKLAIHCWARTTWLSTPPVDLVQSRYIMWSKSNRFSRRNIWKKCSLVVKTTITDFDYLCKLYNTEVFRRLFVF